MHLSLTRSPIYQICPLQREETWQKPYISGKKLIAHLGHLIHSIRIFLFCWHNKYSPASRSPFPGRRSEL
uniref:Uncharacterized protein n=1 Tax=Salix viminalis TaxID=40686 RepID=A0A6N2LV95_SALVM